MTIQKMVRDGWTIEDADRAEHFEFERDGRKLASTVMVSPEDWEWYLVEYDINSGEVVDKYVLED